MSKDDAFFVSVENENTSEFQIKSGFQKIRTVVQLVRLSIGELSGLTRRGSCCSQGEIESPVRSATTTKALSKDDAFFVSVENENTSEFQIKSEFQKIRAVVQLIRLFIGELSSLSPRGSCCFQGEIESPVRSANTTKALSKDDAFFVSIENENTSELQIKSGFQKNHHINSLILKICVKTKTIKQSLSKN
ncbi:hypothetical protein GNP75_15540 [Aliivibrio fischeri]|nr:hypothetical protein [Aliivibrio fischeri]